MSSICWVPAFCTACTTAKKIALLTPYVDEINQMMRRFIEAARTLDASIDGDAALACDVGTRPMIGLARKLGFEKAHSLSGGMGAWRSASLPVEKAEKA